MLNTLAMLLAIATPGPSNTACGLAERVHFLNIPIGTTQRSTEIVNAATVTDGTKLLGYLYMVRNGQSWYQPGILGNGSSIYITLAPPAEVQRTIGIVSSAPAGRPLATLYPTRTGNIERTLWRAGYSINACY